jgi:thioesterase DpgC
MLLNHIETTLNSWLQRRPSLEGSPEVDADILADYLRAGRELLDSLAPKSQRSSEDSRRAAGIQATSRKLRRQFMDVHADWLYGRLTNGLKKHKTLKELAFDAAEVCPELAPTPARIAVERSRLQADKEGEELDQGLFFHALLRSPKIGAHLVESALLPTVRARELLPRFCSEGRLDLGSVLIEKRSGAAHLTINNSHCLNAEDDRLIDDMETAVDLTLLDGDIYVGVLRGGVMKHPRYAGRRVFSAGINLKALHAGQISFVDFLLRREFGYINKIFRGIVLDEKNTETVDDKTPLKTSEKPWIAAVDSFAIGGGAQILLVFDRVIAAEDSYFSLPAAQEGIVPGFSNLRLSRHFGSRKAREIILCGRKIWAHEPDARLLFNEVVDPAKLDDAIERNIHQFKSPGVIANRHMLNLAEEPLELFLHYASEFALVQVERLYAPDVLNKIREFTEGTRSHAKVGHERN